MPLKVTYDEIEIDSFLEEKLEPVWTARTLILALTDWRDRLDVRMYTYGSELIQEFGHKKAKRLYNCDFATLQVGPDYHGQVIALIIANGYNLTPLSNGTLICQRQLRE